MSKAISVSTIQSLTSQEAAAQILALVNSSPRTPWPHEIEAIVAKVSAPAASVWGGCDEAIVEDQKKWCELVIQAEAAMRAADVNKDDIPHDEWIALQRAQGETASRQLEFEESIWARPAFAVSHIPLLADLFVYQVWPGRTLTNTFPGNDPMTLEEMMEEGPECDGGTCDDALGALLRAIRDTLGPVKPLKGLDADLICRVRSAIARHYSAECVASDLNPVDESHPDWLECERAGDVLRAAEASIPYPPRSPLDVLLMAEIAFHGADKEADGITLRGLKHGDCAERPAAKLIESVLAWFGGIRT